MVYVALLRGINVGGNNIIKMVALRAAFEALGFSAVATYIQSGNVVFTAKSGTKTTLTKTIETALAKTFAYDSKVVTVSAKELAAVVAEAPSGFGKEPTRYRYDVLFVKPPLRARAALEEVPTAEGVDEVHAGKHALLLDAGFASVDAYWEGTDANGEGSGTFHRVSGAENDPVWNAYLVARKGPPLPGSRDAARRR